MTSLVVLLGEVTSTPMLPVTGGVLTVKVITNLAGQPATELLQLTLPTVKVPLVAGVSVAVAPFRLLVSSVMVVPLASTFPLVSEMATDMVVAPGAAMRPLL